VKPIIFSTPMVQAILDNRKTQTRRVIKPANARIAKQREFKQGDGFWFGDYENSGNGANIKDYSISSMWQDREKYLAKYARYKVGDILYVRETWAGIYGYADCDEQAIVGYAYRTDYGTTEDDSFPPSTHKWKPSIHMPKEAARIFLLVTGVRAEQLQNISTEDIKREGIIPHPTKPLHEQWQELWDSINAKRGYSFESNPWVWVYDFKLIEKPQE
jgi:hypothetical protein